MTRKNLLAGLAAGVALSACASTEPMPGVGAVEPSPPPGSTPGQCRQAGLDGFVGEPQSPQLEQRIRAASGAREFRWLGPDTIVTMEFRADRVSASLDAGGRVTRVSCG